MLIVLLLPRFPFTGCIAQIRFLKDNLAAWMAPEHVHQPMHLQPGHSVVLRQPKGLVLVISPWNYPVMLSLNMLAAALCAGNCAVLKPSEVSPHCERLLADLVPQYLDPAAVRVVTGGVPETTPVTTLFFLLEHAM